MGLETKHECRRDSDFLFVKTTIYENDIPYCEEHMYEMSAIRTMERDHGGGYIEESLLKAIEHDILIRRKNNIRRINI